ncbi:hypothetical protein [Rubellicoccus peritrichatus]|uniref:VWFA domain-containing protein n=1 Tax=Rubellicoccus peritrichatus TaxID=3080537 RepID=A0AAQ3QV90_9BACT|nr:hypothetical protein [Puniceicoccus sp. CR14]WOO43216.1 hypothetical protein RZN69_08930 [Puniceicoccus sp. CR14]
MPRKRKLNLPLLEVIGISIVLHVAGLLVLGGLTLYEVMSEPEPEFEAPQVAEPIDVKELKVKVNLKKSAEKSAPPRQKIAVQNISQLNVPNLDLDMPTLDNRVSIGFSGAGGGLGRGFGSGGIDIAKSAVNFFGIKSSGERIMIVVDASKYMLEDQKGGIPAYKIIKDEVAQIVQNLSPGTLFNVMFYNGGNVEAFSQVMMPATPQNKDRLGNWITKFNANENSIANVRGNVSISDKSVKPMEGLAFNWIKAAQAANEMNSDAIFLLVGQWQHHPRYITPEEKQKYLNEVKWGEEEETKWGEAVNVAQAWLKEENQKRRASGKPIKIVHSNHVLIHELKDLGVIEKRLRLKPDAAFNQEEIVKYMQGIGRKYGKEHDRKPASTNIVLFLGADEDEDENRDVEKFKDVARKNRGKFRVLEGMDALENVTTRGSSRSRS